MQSHSVNYHVMQVRGILSLHHSYKWLFVLKAELKNKQVQEMNRFMHYYSRFKNHENSYKVSTVLL